MKMESATDRRGSPDASRTVTWPAHRTGRKSHVPDTRSPRPCWRAPAADREARDPSRGRGLISGGGGGGSRTRVRNRLDRASTRVAWDRLSARPELPGRLVEPRLHVLGLAPSYRRASAGASPLQVVRTGEPRAGLPGNASYG